MIYRIFVAHPPMNNMAIVSKYLRESCAPASIAYYACLPYMFIQN
jgi:hypothetical protein